MASIKPFKSIRPSEQMAEVIAALPYDVYNRAEAKEVVAKNPKSFLAIDRAETQFPDDVDTYDERVYKKASEMLREWIDRGDFIKDSKDCYCEHQIQVFLSLCLIGLLAYEFYRFSAGHHREYIRDTKDRYQTHTKKTSQAQVHRCA